jgi:hypothetical protein
MDPSVDMNVVEERYPLLLSGIEPGPIERRFIWLMTGFNIELL